MNRGSRRVFTAAVAVIAVVLAWGAVSRVEPLAGTIERAVSYALVAPGSSATSAGDTWSLCEDCTPAPPTAVPVLLASLLLSAFPSGAVALALAWAVGRGVGTTQWLPRPEVLRAGLWLQVASLGCALIGVVWHLSFAAGALLTTSQGLLVTVSAAFSLAALPGWQTALWRAHQHRLTGSRHDALAV